MCIRDRYDSDRDVIKETVHALRSKGHVIDVLYWGKQLSLIHI